MPLSDERGSRISTGSTVCLSQRYSLFSIIYFRCETFVFHFYQHYRTVDETVLSNTLSHLVEGGGIDWQKFFSRNDVRPSRKLGNGMIRAGDHFSPGYTGHNRPERITLSVLVKRRKTGTMHLAQCNAKQGHGSIHQGVGVGLSSVCACVWVVGLSCWHTCPSTSQCESRWLREHLYTHCPRRLLTVAFTYAVRANTM